jgi:hypothetical protein
MPNLDLTEGYTEAGASCAGSSARGPVGAAAGAILRYLDVVLLAVAAPVALTLGAPALGYAIGAGVWIVQRILAQLDRRLIAGAREPRRFGLNLVEAFGRIWLLAGGIVVAGVVGGRADGLTAALLIFGAYSVAFAVRLVDGRPLGGPER